MKDWVLREAVRSGKIDTIRKLVAEGISVNDVDEQGITPLHLAAKLGKIDIIEVLLENGADARIKSARGQTPLDWAQAVNNIGAMSLLGTPVQRC